MIIPPKPKSMSEKRYRELYDSTPVFVTVVDLAVIKCAGAISAAIVTKSYTEKGYQVEVSSS